MPSSNQAEVTAPGSDAFVGQIIDGRFHIQELIGTGGMGRVYRAQQKPLNRRVALKILNRGYGAATDELFRKRFMLEAKLTSQLSHPNTVTVLDYGCTAEGDFWFAMEFLEGDTLAELLARDTALAWPRVLTIGQQICRSLREAHKLGVVHRDLKPANVMLLRADDDHDQVKVLDFGLVKQFGKGPERGITKQGTLMGSPGYMAPEQAEHNISDPRSDIYSLGVVMYEALAGKPPFEGRHQIDVILKHINDAPPEAVAPKDFAPIPPAVSALVLKCMAKDPNDRFQSMDEVLSAMALAGAPGTPGSGTFSAVARPAPSRIGPTAVFLAIAFAFVAAAFAFVYRAYAPVVHGPTSAVHFHVDSEPAGARVLMRGNLVGVTPMEFDLPAKSDGSAQAELVIEHDGYQTLTVSAGGFGPRVELKQKLQPLPPGSAPPAAAEPVASTPAASAANEPLVEYPTAGSAQKKHVHVKRKHFGTVKNGKSIARLGDDEDEEEIAPEVPVLPPPGKKDAASLKTPK